MKLLEVAGVKKIWHSSPKELTKLDASPAMWFALSADKAKHWHDNGVSNHSQQYTYQCEYTGGNIATIAQTRKIVKKIWPKESLLYSMFDERVGEYQADEVRAFIKACQEAGFDAAYVEDYDPADFSNSWSKTLVVFRPDQHVKIVKLILAKRPTPGVAPKAPAKPYEDYKISERVKFYNSALNKREGEIIKIIPKTTKINPHDHEDDPDHSIYAWADIAESDAFEVQDDNGKKYLVPFKSLIV